MLIGCLKVSCILEFLVSALENNLKLLLKLKAREYFSVELCAVGLLLSLSLSLVCFCLSSYFCIALTVLVNPFTLERYIKINYVSCSKNVGEVSLFLRIVL